MFILDLLFDSFEKKQEKQLKESIENQYICPHCQEYITFTFGKIRDEKKIYCNHCGYLSIVKNNKLQIAHKLNCPYCNYSHTLVSGYYICICGNSFRVEALKNTVYDGIILKQDETINDVIFWTISLLKQITLLSRLDNDGRFDYYKNLVINIFELNDKQIAWCKEKKLFSTGFADLLDDDTENSIESIIKNIKDMDINEKDFLQSLCYWILKIGYYENKYQNFAKIEDSIKKTIQLNNDLYETIKQEILQEMGISSIDITIYFKILGLSPDANEKDIKKSYRQLVKQYHPDKYLHQNLSDSEIKLINEKFIQIQDAYEKIKEYI